MLRVLGQEERAIVVVELWAATVTQLALECPAQAGPTMIVGRAFAPVLAVQPASWLDRRGWWGREARAPVRQPPKWMNLLGFPQWPRQGLAVRSAGLRRHPASAQPPVWCQTRQLALQQALLIATRVTQN